MYGKWVTPAKQYIDEVRWWMQSVGKMQWAAVQDWMCEPIMLQKTGLTIQEHQRRTTHSYLHLKAMAPEVPWCPVLQGFRLEDYLAHIEEYHRALPFPLRNFRIVGVGSICRRQGTREAFNILKELHGHGLKLHGFGLKVTGMYNGAAAFLESCDSMAWSRAARYEKPMEGCTHKKCNNCIKYAMKWQEQVLASATEGERSYRAKAARPVQQFLDFSEMESDAV
jgi:hypothetical protein